MPINMFLSRGYKPVHGGRSEQTLAEYYERKGVKKPLTFDEWWDNFGLRYDLSVKKDFMDCWDAAQEQMR